MVWKRASGLRPSSAASSSKSLLSIIIRAMSASCSNVWATPCNGPPRVWSKPTRRRKTDGFVTPIRALKKSPNGRSGDRFRGRGILPPDAHLARDLGAVGQPAANSYARRAPHAEDFRSRPVGQRPIYLPASTGVFPVGNLCGVFGGGGRAGVLPPGPSCVSHPGQRLLSQKAGNL